jgi:hypothetical protein
MATIETVFFLFNSRGYMIRRLLVGIPVSALVNALVSCFVFNWRPGGAWVPLTMTLAWWLSTCATYPFKEGKGEEEGRGEEKGKGNFPSHAKRSFVVSFGVHGGVVGFIYALVLSVRLLAKSGGDGDGDGVMREVLTLFVTGVAFPGFAFVVRKIITGIIFEHVGDSGGTREERMKMYANISKGMSSLIMFMPTVLLYLNTNVLLALLSALGQMGTENAGKIGIVLLMKRRMERELAVASAAGGGEAELLLEKKRHDQQLATLAIRWNSELVAEKGSIVNAALVAFLYLGGLVDGDAADLAGVGLVFFVVEVATDVVFVHVMNGYFDVPILSAVPEVGVLSRDNLAGAAMMALGFNGMAQCIAMAASVPLGRA